MPDLEANSGAKGPLSPAAEKPAAEKPVPEQSANPKYAAQLAVAAALILMLGSFVRPKVKAPDAPVSTTETVRLRRLGQKTSLENMTRYFSEIAAELSPRVVRLRGVESSGLIWNDQGGILAANPGGWFPEAVEVISPTGMRFAARTTIAAPHSPVALLEGPANASLAPGNHLSPDMLKQGEWILALARQPNGSYLFAPGWHSGVASFVCGEHPYRRFVSNLVLTEAMVGGGLFDLNGNLLAVIVRCGDFLAAIGVEDARAALDRANTAASRLLRRYGFQVEPLDDASREYFQAEQGLWVSAVWKGFPAERAGLAPGDLLVEVNGAALSQPGDLEPLALAGEDAAWELRVRRPRRTVSLSLSAGVSPPAAPDAGAAAGLVLEPPATGYRIQSVVAGSPAAAAGIRPGDLLLQIGNTTVRGPAAVRQLLSSPNRKPVLVVLERGPKILGLLLK